MKKLIVGAFVVGCLSGAFAGTNGGWVKYAGNPVLGSPELGTCFDLDVVPWGTAKFNSYFSWRSQECIALSRSDDGIHWSEPVRCLEPDEASGWEDVVNRATVWFKDGTYHMWYSAQARGYSKIGYATSKDGVRFTRVSKTPVMIPRYPYEGFSVMNPCVRWDDRKGCWRMWYASGETFEPNVLCYAESKDGLSWERSPLNPILARGGKNTWDRNRVGACSVQPLKDGRWVMFYIGYTDIDTANIGVAISQDGISGWKRLAANPIVSPTPKAWDSSACYKPSVFWDEAAGKWLLWYNGRTAGREYIGLVEHKGYDLGPEEHPYNVVLPQEQVRQRFDRFNLEDDELYKNQFSNAGVFFNFRQFPLFECPDEDISRTYYFRWWTFRKHLKKTPSGWVVTEFLPNVPWAGKENTISCPFGHHMREGRWLRSTEFLDDYIRFMVTEGTVNGPRAYACWPAWGALERAKVTGDRQYAISLLPQFVKNYELWEKGWAAGNSASIKDMGGYDRSKKVPIQAGFRPERGLFDFIGNREGTEFALSHDGARPMVNAAMWAEATAIAQIAAEAGDKVLSEKYAAKADALRKNICERLWNPTEKFFTALSVAGEQDDVCELHGYAPFYFRMPLASSYQAAFRPLVEETGFAAPKGLTFPMRKTPGFNAEIDYRKHECLWDGPSWPYATSVALTALYENLQGKDASAMPIGAGDFVKLLKQYAAQQVLVREDGKTVPWIDENLHAFTGQWLARHILVEQAKLRNQPVRYPERGKDYNHSTFNDLVISGLCGVIPQADGKIVLKPLAPAEWDWWCVDGIRYHGRDLTVLFDRDGTRYGKGKGLVVLVDGKSAPFELLK